MSQPPPSLASTPSSPRPKQPRSEQPRRRKEAQRLTEEARHVAASGRLDAAIELLRSAVRADHTFGEAYLWWGVCESHMGRDREALQRLAIAEQQLVSEARNSAGDRLQRASTGAFEAGNALYRLDRKDEALAAYHRALSHNPQSPEALSNLGVLQYTARRYDEAAALFKRAITVAPSFPDAHQHLGAARKALGDAPGALRSYQESARLSPRNSEAFRGVALVLRERGRLPEAIAALTSALAIAPADPQLHIDVGITHDYAERREDAMSAYEAAARQVQKAHGGVAATSAGAAAAGDAGKLMLSARYLHGRAAKSMALWRGWDAYNWFLRDAVRRPGGAARLSVDPVASLSSPFTGPELLAVVKAAAEAKLAESSDGSDGVSMGGGTAAAARHSPAAEVRRGGERLTVGLVSSYFRDHNLLRLTRSLFSLADRSELRLVLFAESEDDGTEILRRTQEAVEGFVRIRSMSTADAVDQMARHRLHLAINLNGHHWNSASESVRFGLFNRRSAPVTAAYMGYPGPTGARNIYYTYVDAHAAPAAHASHFTERLVHLPHTYYLNDYANSHRNLPRGAAIPPSADSFSTKCAYMCSLNQLPKTHPDLFAAWMNILSRTASKSSCTRLWILRFPASGVEHLRRESRAHASPPPRKSLLDLPTVPHADHLLRSQHCDLKLDSTLCNAHTSGTDALWAGTPMLTLPAETQTSRVALSLLQSVGQPELSVKSMREYEDMGAELMASKATSQLYMYAHKGSIRGFPGHDSNMLAPEWAFRYV